MLHKFIRDELGFGKTAHNERPMSVHIPYTRHVSDTVVRLDNGALAETIEAEQDEIAETADIIQFPEAAA